MQNMDIKTLHPAIAAAYRVLETGEPISLEEAELLASLPGEFSLDLASLANKVRNRWGKGGIHACSIMNAKSGSVARIAGSAPSRDITMLILRFIPWLTRMLYSLRPEAAPNMVCLISGLSPVVTVTEQ